jgi:hypothetical protein
MARFKVYYPVEEITTNLYTTGKQWMTKDGREYIGLYHTYITGEAYTQPSWNPKLSVELIAYIDPVTPTIIQYQKLKPDLNLLRLSPRSISLSISNENIKQGYVMRYFLCKRTDRSILEVDMMQYKFWQNDQIDKKIFTAAEVKWYITGAIQDTINKSVLVPGVITKNSESRRIASNTIPELLEKLSNLTEFYTDTDYIAPIDINGLN